MTILKYRHYCCVDPENLVEGPYNFFQSSTYFSAGAVGPHSMGPIPFRGVSIPEFLRKPIVTCDFRGVGSGVLIC